jgi:hypothetical protein
MGNQKELGERIRQFARALPVLCSQLDGDDLIDSVHRLYEALLCQTPRELLDVAHDAMHLLMHRHGLVRRPPGTWSSLEAG